MFFPEIISQNAVADTVATDIDLADAAASHSMLNMNAKYQQRCQHWYPSILGDKLQLAKNNKLYQLRRKMK